jgi:hypothetical protein
VREKQQPAGSAPHGHVTYVGEHWQHAACNAAVKHTKTAQFIETASEVQKKFNIDA